MSEPAARRPVVVGSGARSSGEVARAFLAFNVDPKPGPTTVFGKSSRQRVHLRFVGNRWVSPGPVSLVVSLVYAQCSSPSRPFAVLGVDPSRSDVSIDGRS